MRIILSGVSGFSRRWVDVCFKTPSVQVAALVNHRPEKLDEACAERGLPRDRAFTTLGEALAKTEADAVLVTVPTKFHFTETRQALLAGKHVLVEKPLTETLSQARKLAALAERRNKVLSVVSQHRFAPYLRTIKRYCAKDGPLGRPLTFVVRIHANRPASYYDHPLHRTGHGVLAIQGAHALDWIGWLFGPAKSVAAATGTLYHKTNNEDNAYGLITMESGVMVLLDINHFNKADDLIEYSLHAQEGVLRYTPADGIVIERGDKREQVEFEKVDPHFDSLRAQLENFVQAVEGKGELEVSSADGLHVMKLLDGLYRSAERTVRI